MNALAYPASGLTIAYTRMFLQKHESNDHSAKNDAGYSRSEMAYPGLVASAKGLQSLHTLMRYFGWVWTIISTVILAIVVYGTVLTARFEEAHKAVDDSISQIYTQVDSEKAENASGAPTLAKGTADLLCDVRTIAERSSKMKLLCNQRSFNQALYEKSIKDVAAFAERYRFLTQIWIFPASIEPSWREGHPENVQSVKLVLSAYTNYVLPVFFGLLGAIAYFLRNIGNRVTGSTLAPRDETLIAIRLILGAIAGTATGLLFRPDSVPAVNSGAGMLALSTPAIAFLAAYGADGFFRMIEALIARIFSLDPPDKPSPPR
ncbi:hypothetical protein AB3X91_41090 [Paraburkholderia sp. BR14263]|uniref:hypothetical protein n=1 Tax=unclassified Paraburkholderia TaxID=2615204 RepID=UPI0034CE283C